MTSERREQMRPIRPERQVADADHGLQRQIAILMREQRPATRDFPFQAWRHPRLIAGDQHQPVLAGAMLGDRGDDLVGPGEMDEAVGLVLRRAGIAPGGQRRFPFGLLADVIDHARLPFSQRDTSSHCQVSSPAEPTMISRRRFSIDRASPISGAMPNRPQTRMKPPSCTPSAPGTAKPALRAAIPRLSMMKAWRKVTSWPMASNPT